MWIHAIYNMEVSKSNRNGMRLIIVSNSFSSVFISWTTALMNLHTRVNVLTRAFCSTIQLHRHNVRLSTQLTFTYSKWSTENYKKMWNICSKVILVFLMLTLNIYCQLGIYIAVIFNFCVFFTASYFFVWFIGDWRIAVLTTSAKNIRL